LSAAAGSGVAGYVQEILILSAGHPTTDRVRCLRKVVNAAALEGGVFCGDAQPPQLPARTVWG
jgi:hypothetical protein